jgi:hypothetical protein
VGDRTRRKVEIRPLIFLHKTGSGRYVPLCFDVWDAPAISFIVLSVGRSTTHSIVHWLWLDFQRRQVRPWGIEKFKSLTRRQDTRNQHQRNIISGS